MKTSFHIDKDDYSSKVFKHLYEGGKNFAIFSANKLPEIAEMKLYVTLGQLSVKINPKPIMITINKLQQLNDLRKFHGMLFRELLKTTRDFLLYDYSNNENSYYIVPMINFEIDWKLIEQFQQLSTCKKTTIQERQNMVLEPNDFLYKTVTPWYPDDVDQR